MILIQYTTVWNMIVIYKYTYTLIHNHAFTQDTHIFSEKFKITVAVCVVQIKAHVTWNNRQHLTGNFQTDIYSILTLCYLSYDTHVNFIITTQTSQKLYLCRCKYIPMYRYKTMSPLLCTPMWMCTYQHCDERRKRWAETLQKSHEGT